MSELLNKCALFKCFSESETRSLLNKIPYQVQSYQKNEIIFSPEAPSNHVGIVLSGKVEVMHLHFNGQVLLVGHKNPFDIVAGPTVYSSEPNYGITLMALSSTKLMLFEKSAFTKLLQSHPSILEAYLIHLSDQARYLRNRLYMLSLPNICQKITCSLYVWANLPADQLHNDSIEVKIPFTKQKWAEYLGVTPQSLSRCLQNMVQKKMISIHHRNITIYKGSVPLVQL